MATMLRKHKTRRGAAMVEGAVVLGVCVLFLLGIMELLLLVLNHTLMAEGSRRVARAAIVHGDRCGSAGEWGPGEVTLSASADHPAACVLREMLLTIPSDEVALEIRWLDGDNSLGDRVRVRVQHAHQPILPVWGWNTDLVLSGQSTMLIAH